MSASTNLQLPFLAQGQAQKHVTVNESLLRLDAIVQLSVVSATTSAQPASPSDGQVYILPAGKTGADWSAMADCALAYYRDGAWEEIGPREGFLAHVKDTDVLLHYSGAAWLQYSAAQALAISATDKILGRIAAGAGAAEEIAFTDQAQQLCDDTSFAAMRTTLATPGLADANTFTAVNQFSFADNLVEIGPSSLAFARLTRASAAASGAPAFGLQRARGAIGTPTQLSANDVIGQFFGSPLNSGGAYTGQARVRFRAGEAHGAAALGTNVEILATPNGSTTEAVEATFQNGLVLAGASGGAKGVGTINATALYDDNVLLTCGPLEFLIEGKLDLDKWDALALENTSAGDVELPALEAESSTGENRTRRHEVMHAFVAMLADGFDPRDPDNFCARMKADGAVPGLMTQNEWRDMTACGDKLDVGTAMTRTFLAIDNIAVAFAGLTERATRLEQRLALLEKD